MKNNLILINGTLINLDNVSDIQESEGGITITFTLSPHQYDGIYFLVFKGITLDGFLSQACLVPNVVKLDKKGE